MWLTTAWQQRKPALHTESFPLPQLGQITWHKWFHAVKRRMTTTTRSQRELTCFTVPASCPVPLNLKHKVNHAHVYVTEIFQDQICPVVTFLSFTATDHYETDQQSLMLSEKATSERIKKRGLHHPLTRDSILLRVNAIQRARCTDEVSINMEWNARLRDSWGPHTLQEPLHADLQPLKHKLHICPLWHSHDDHPRRAKSCVPTVKTVSQNITNTLGKRPVTTAPDTMRRCRLCSCSKTAQPQNVSTYTVTHCVKTGTNLPTINTFRPVQRAARVQAGHRSSVWTYSPNQEELIQSCEQNCVRGIRGCHIMCQLNTTSQ